MALPALRYVDAFPVDHNGQRLICLRDPEGIVEQQILLTPAAFFIASQLDGRQDAAAVQQAFAQQFGGQRLRQDDMHRLIAALDRQGFLRTDRFHAMKRHVEATFVDAAVRPAYLAGKSYPAQAGSLKAFFDEQFARRKGGPKACIGAQPHAGAPLRCLVAPHIDYHRGGHAYAQAYLRLYRRGRPDVVIIFGVAHVSPPVPFILTRKDFATPFGVVRTDRELVRHLAAACAWDPYAYEIVHRTEHSIEFQVVMLAYLFGADIRIVPILCGTFGSETGHVAPGDIHHVRAFLDTCRDLVASLGQRVSVIAGADLAHVGRRFGDDFDVSDRTVEDVETRDREDLHHVTAGDAEGFYRSVMQDHNQRRICGLNCIYASLKTLSGAGTTGELIHYDYAHDPAGGIVSFADVVFT